MSADYWPTMKSVNPARVRSLHRALFTWYRRHRRELQWRTTSDPYEILVSEIMLHQTQVSRVRVKLPSFLKQFPDIAALACAPKSDVIRAWSGMGYNNRAVRLHQLGQILQEKYGGMIPETTDELLKLPGVGLYTAMAVQCFAFRRRVPIVDVNISRVLSRLFRISDGTNTVGRESEIWQLATRILPRSAYTWNQALMDLGATVCLARSPKCTVCPLREHCPTKNLLGQAMTRTNRRANVEPVHGGIPRRIWRGRIIHALRGLDGYESMTMRRLARTLRRRCSGSENAWLLGVLRGLEKDGLISIGEVGPSVRVRLARE